VSREDACACAVSGSRRGTRRGARAVDALRRRAGVAAAARFRPPGAARFAVRFAGRFMLRLADRFAVFLFDAVLLDALRDFVAVFAVFRRFLAMRAP